MKTTNLFSGTRFYREHEEVRPGYDELYAYVSGILSLKLNMSGKPYCNKYEIQQMTNCGDHMITVTVRLATDAMGWSNDYGYTVPEFSELKEWIDSLHGCRVSRIASAMSNEGMIINSFAITPSFDVKQAGSHSFSYWIRFGRFEQVKRKGNNF